MKYLIIFAVLFLSMLSTAEKITVLTEEFPPFSYTENGKITGASTEIVEAVFKEAGIDYEIKVLPWARAINEAQREKNSALYSTMRLPEREKLFKWIGEITVPGYSVYALKYRTDIEIKTMEDLKKYKIGTVKDDSREQFFINKGFVIGKNIDQIAGSEATVQNLKKLEIKRIDLWPMPDAVAEYIVRQQGKDPDQLIRKVYALEELSKTGLYLAMHKDTPDVVVIKLQTAFKKLKKSGFINRVLAKWRLV